MHPTCNRPWDRSNKLRFRHLCVLLSFTKFSTTDALTCVSWCSRSGLDPKHNNLRPSPSLSHRVVSTQCRKKERNMSKCNSRLSMSTTSDGVTDADLQKRYEDAMKRREMRRFQKQVLPKELEEEVLTNENDDEIETDIQRSNSGEDGRMSSDENENVDRSKTADIEQGNSFQPREPKRQNQKSRFQVYETYFEEDYFENEYYSDEPYTPSISRNKPSIQWETYKSTSILFPPPSKSNCPKAIIHFVGGTFFGSYPRKFYGKFLEDIAIKCNAVVVATPIPLVLPGKGLVDRLGNWLFDDSIEDIDLERSRGDGREHDKKNNPLNHLNLAEAVQREFNNVYRDVIIDEYCADFSTEEEVEKFMSNVPIVGIGHSLGARIQAISCCHPKIIKYLAMGKGRRLIRSGRDGMVYLGFANWGASTSIPGVETLEQTVRKKEISKREEVRNRRGVGEIDDIYGDRRKRPQQNRKRIDSDDRRSRYGRSYDRYSQYDVDDFDLYDVFEDIISGVTTGAKQISAALTPDSDDLEFKPSPEELWDSLASSRGGYSSRCQKTLIVQFDEDPIDQGSRLARTLLKVASETDAQEDKSVANILHDVKFARLKGGHLTPVSFRDGIAKILPNKVLAALTSSSDYIVQQLGDETSKSSRRLRDELSDVVDTVASYIRDVI